MLGLATGSSPLPVYDELVRRCADGRISFSRATAFLLDEYIGLPAGHPESYRAVIDRTFTGLVDFAAGAVHVPDGTAADVEAACRAYEDAIAAAGGVDLQLLGIGRDGHIGFNEPSSSLGSRTRVKTLTSQTVSDNDRFFGPVDEVPRHVVTQGVGTILDARHLVLDRRGCRQGRTDRPGGRGTGDVDGPWLGPPAPPPRHRRRRRRRGRRGADAGRLLPGDLGRQARVAGPVALPRGPR